MSGTGERARFRRLAEVSREGDSSDFDLHPELRPKGLRATPAAVLVAFVDRGQGGRVILTRRTTDLRHHPGQVAFPGGKLDPSDADAVAAALREAEEEIGLPPAMAEPLGALAPHQTVTGFSVTPILAEVDPAFRPAPHEGEVAEVFEVPLAFLMDPANTRIEGRIWRGATRRYYTMPYGPYYIWGATARMLVGMQALWRRLG